MANYYGLTYHIENGVAYDWPAFDHVPDLDLEALYLKGRHEFLEDALLYAEMEKQRNQAIGETRAEQELAFRDAIVSAKSEKIGKSEKIFWITINPKKDTPLATLLKCVHKMYSKKWITNCAYIFETTSNNHEHSHGLIKCNYESARARKELANSVKDICDISNVHCFKFVEITAEVAGQKMAYMQGKKKSKKMSDVDLTKQWRETNNIQELYSRGAPILLAPRESITSETDYDLLPASTG